jgi:hypothetical protein
MEELTTEQKIERGREAKRFLESAVFVGVLKECEQIFIDRWINSDDERVQKASWSSIHALAEVETRIREIMNNGLMEEAKQKKQ